MSEWPGELPTGYVHRWSFGVSRPKPKPRLHCTTCDTEFDADARAILECRADDGFVKCDACWAKEIAL